MKEQWENTDYDYIQVSNLGNVRTKDTVREFNKYNRLNKTHVKTKRLIKSHIMKQQKNNKGYLFVCYKQGGKRKNILVHRLVAQAFIPNPNNKKEVNHIDGNPLNNIVSNLEWCTSSENRTHAYYVLGRPCFGKYKK